MMEQVKNVPMLRFPPFGDSWTGKTLGSLSKGVLYGMNSSAIKFDGENKYLRITDIDEETRQFTPRPLTSPDGNIEERYKLKEGDIVFARTGAGVGRSYLYRQADGNLLYAGFLIKFSIIGADPYFVYANTFRSEYHKWVKLMSMRSGQPGINAEEYKQLSFYLPSLPEQQKIASFLTSVDEKIQQLSKKKSLLEQYKKGLMQQLFSQKLRFKDDQGNEFPDWEEKTLDDVGDIIGGGTPETYVEKYWGGEIIWFTPTELKSKYVQGSLRRITREGIANSSAKLLPKGTVLLTSRATVGDVSIASQECCTNQGFQSIIVNPQNVNEFIYYWLIQNKHQLLKRASGSTFMEINKTEISKLGIMSPSFEEQTKIANFLSAIDDKINRVNQQIEHTQQFKKGLLQQMFV